MKKAILVIFKKSGSVHLRTFKNISEYYWNRQTLCNEYKHILTKEYTVIEDGINYWCIKNGYKQFFSLLNINLLLIIATIYNNSKAVKYLIKLGADIHFKDDWLLSVAVNKGNIKLVKFFIKIGLNPNRCMICPPLYWSRVRNFKDIELYLIKKGAIHHQY